MYKSRGLGVAGVVAALLMAGCGSDDKPAANPDPAAANLTPLQQALREIKDDGSWTKETALEAFAAAIGELPGVTAPRGPQPKVEFSGIAIRMLMRHWDAITPDQQAAARRLLGTSMPQRTASSVRKAAAPLPADVIYAADAAAHQAVLDQAIVDIAARVGRTLSFVPVAVIDANQVGKNYAQAIGDADAGGTYRACTVHVYPLAAGLPVGSVEMRAVLAHEAWHCFQYDRLSYPVLQSLSPWVFEGQAMWVGEALVGGTTGLEPTDTHWTEYLLNPGPGGALYARSYDAIGFYAHLDDVGINVWQVLDRILAQGGSNVAAFNAALGASMALPSWGSSWFLDGKPTTDFDLVKAPGRPRGDIHPPAKKIALAANAVGNLDTRKAASAAIGEVHVDADVLRVQVTGTAIMGDLAGPVFRLAAESRVFCVKQPCKCPDGTSPIDAGNSISADSRLAVTGDATIGSSAQLEAFSIDEFCKPTPPTSEVWHGTWKSTIYPISGTFELKYNLVAGIDLLGEVTITGSDCVSAGVVHGTLSGNAIKFGVVEAAKTVAWEGTISGANAGATMAGSYTASGCGADSGTWQAIR